MGRWFNLLRPLLPRPRLTDHVLYMVCRRCGWRANINGVGMRNECPVCRQGALTMLGGTIAEVAARLAQMPESGA